MAGELRGSKGSPKNRRLPVLVLCYNRPLAVLETINSVRLYQPSRLYVACDGPKPEDSNDETRVRAVRDVVKGAIDWDCETRFLYHSRNEGLRVGVYKSISWFFSQEDMGIVLEDDCVASADFYRLCEFFLARYSTEKKVWGITGNNNSSIHVHSDATYGFLRVPLIWGWASWSNRWELVKTAVEDPNIEQRLAATSWPSEAVRHALEWKVRAVLEGRVDSWAYLFSQAMVWNQGLWALPKPNLVTNIGGGQGATNTHRLPAEPWEPLGTIREPKAIYADSDFEHRVLRKSHRVLSPLWANHLRDFLRMMRLVINGQ